MILRELGEQFLGCVFRFLHVWLIERIDAQSPTGARSRKLPGEKLRAELVKVRQLALDDRMTRIREDAQVAIRVRQRDRDEHTIVAVDRRIAERLADDGHDSLTLFAGAFGDELFDPQTERLELRIDHKG